MAEYIELEVAVKAFNNFDAGRADSPPCTLLTPEEFAEYLYELPTADVAPVVHGRWGTGRFNLETGNYEKQCTRCRNFSKEYGKPYCPHCGAKMDGGNSDAAD